MPLVIHPSSFKLKQNIYILYLLESCVNDFIHDFIRILIKTEIQLFRLNRDGGPVIKHLAVSV